MSNEQTTLAFDYGKVRIGVAVGHQPGELTRRLSVVRNSPAGPDWAAITKLVDEWLPDQLVVGLSRHADGSDSPVTKAIRRFAHALGEQFSRPVHLEDERLSSVAAREVLVEEGLSHAKIQKQLDSEAARQILLSWSRQARR